MTKTRIVALAAALVGLIFCAYGQKKGRPARREPLGREQSLYNEAYREAKRFWDTRIAHCNGEYWFAAQSTEVNNKFVFECRRLTNFQVTGQALYPRQLSESEKLNRVDPLPVEWSGNIKIEFETCRRSISGNGFQQRFGAWYDKDSLGNKWIKKIKGTWQLAPAFEIGNDLDKPLPMTCPDVATFLAVLAGRGPHPPSRTNISTPFETMPALFVATVRRGQDQRSDRNLWLRLFGDGTAVFVTTDASWSVPQLNRCLFPHMTLAGGCGDLPSHVFEGNFSINGSEITVQASASEGSVTFKGNVSSDSLQLDSHFPNGSSGNFRFQLVNPTDEVIGQGHLSGARLINTEGCLDVQCQTWLVTLVKSDGWFDTGIRIYANQKVKVFGPDEAFSIRVGAVSDETIKVGGKTLAFATQEYANEWTRRMGGLGGYVYLAAPDWNETLQIRINDSYPHTILQDLKVFVGPTRGM